MGENQKQCCCARPSSNEAGPKGHIPLFPPEFGEDKGEFFKHYDKIQDELDDEMVKRLKENLDGLLVFAGLFAGVNSAFLAFTLDLVSSNPLDDISSLLKQIMEGLKSPMSLPSMTFAPSLKAVIINALFTLSLSSALFASFFAVLGKQWLMLYRNRNGGGVDQQRWEQLKRSLGAERWGLVPVLEIVLPVLIQTSLVIFAAGFVTFLQTTSETLAIFVLVPLVVVSFLWVLTVGFSLWDISCPFKNPLCEIILRAPLVVSAIIHLIFRHKQTRAKNAELFHAMKKKLGSWRRRPHAGHNREATLIGDDIVMEKGYRNTKDDEETGKATAIVAVRDAPLSSSPTPLDQPGSHKDRWGKLAHSVISKRPQMMVESKTSFWNLMTNLRHSIASFWNSFWGFPLGRIAEDEKVLQVKSIKRVINISEDPKALYHAALNLRSITNLDLLQLVCNDEDTTRSLRECYVEALEELKNKSDLTKQHPKLLREALAFGTTFFHVSISAASFDEFITIIGMKDVILPLQDSEISPQVAQEAGDNCRRAQTFVRQYMNLQMYQLDSQPVALTSTTLAASTLWYAINGIPHSQDIIYGDQFRESLAYSEVSWAGLGLLTLVSNKPCKFSDASQRKPYGIKDIDRCRKAFLRVKEAYYLCGPTQELAEAIHDSLSTGNNLGTNAVLFKFSWRLFTKDEEGDNIVEWGKRALSAGHHLVCALEKAIRSQKAIESQETIKSREAIKSLEAIGSAEGSSAAEAMSAQLMLSAQAALSSAEANRSTEAMGTQAASKSAEAITAQKALAALAAITAGRSRKPKPGTQEELSTQAAISALKALSAQKAARKYERARETCFKAMIECMGPRDDEFKILKRTAWRQKLTLKTATEYMNYILKMEEPVIDGDKDFAKRVMEQIRHAQVQSLPAVLAMGREYTDIKREFEEAFSKL
ncbi:hypothetical protein FRC01_006531 [Tulasnella sp. 417]|nr:hypothetical protein FRC01_006531 [Tulasnella sp. 417]